MALAVNYNAPTILFADLNSCFASIEQQANPLLRGKPVVVAAYDSPKGCVVAPSIEAKRFGIKTGMQVWQAKLLYPAVVVRTPDPPKYRYVHQKFAKIFRDYSPSVTPLSIDEAVLDLASTLPLFKGGIVGIGREIKRRIKTEIGEWVLCSVGIATNRFLAKVAAELHKPDGLEVIDHTNILSVYQKLTLLDLPGINVRYQARLNARGIFTPLDFYTASLETLKNLVFKGVVGRYWYYRLRGYEIDAVEFGRKSFGNTYALGKKTKDHRELSKLLMKLCEKTGRRMRRSRYQARGVQVAVVFTDYTWWHKGRCFDVPVYSTQEIFVKAQRLLNETGYQKTVGHLAVAVYDLVDGSSEQLGLFTDRAREAADAADEMNDRYGEFTVVPALMMRMGDIILDRISFGGVKELREMYE
jgi:DNA polymerase-4